MLYQYIVTRDAVEYELYVDGDVRLAPIQQVQISRDTLDLRARMYNALLKRYLIRHPDEHPASASLRCLDTHGFAIADIEP